MSELETEFGNLPGGNPKQSRFLRSQQDLKEKMEAAADDDGEGGDDGRAVHLLYPLLFANPPLFANYHSYLSTKSYAVAPTTLLKIV